MRPLFRRPRSVTATLVCLSAVYACGGGDSLESEPFTAAAGVYNVTGRFDDLPSATSYFTGTLTLTLVHGVVTVAAGACGFLAVLALREVMSAIMGQARFQRISASVQAALVVALATALLLLP